MASSAGPKLTKNVETNIGAHENAKANRTISRAGDAARLPCPRNEGRTGRTTNARKGERLVAIVMPCERRAHNGVLGFNAFWLRGTPHTLEILQSLGFIYHIDDVSRDEPFLINLRDKPFAVVPYTLHMNDIVDYETRYFSTAMYADDLKAEFDALYAEAGTRRRMMSLSAHDRIAGRPSRAKVLEQFIVDSGSPSSTGRAAWSMSIAC